jgi:DNA invertase Pin-like site-specific DNA recombinase
VARPTKKIDEASLRRMVAEGIQLRRIASLLGVSHDTLTRRFATLVKPVTQKRDGRPQKELNPKKVRQLASYGLSIKEVSAMLGVSDDTISRRFAADFQSGCAHRDGKLKAAPVFADFKAAKR